MTCPDAGRWRAWLDGEAPSDATEHLSVCERCQATLADLQRGRAVAAEAIATLAPAAIPSPAVARARLTERLDRQGQPTATLLVGPWTAIGKTFRRWRLAAAGLAAGLVLGVVVLTPTGQTAAAQFLAQFRSQQFVAVPVDSQRDPFRDLEQVGTVRGSRGIPPETVATLADASRRVGFDLKQPDSSVIPAGLNRTPTIRVSPAHEERFTFDRAKARAYFDRTGHPEVNLPEKYGGASLVVAVPAAAMLEYGTNSSHALVIGQAGELSIGVDGSVTLEELRDFLLSLPNVPPATASQLRAIQDWRNTLPIPVPVDQFKWQDTTIAGGPGLLLTETSGVGTAAIWQRNGHVYGIVGTIKPDELQAIAASLLR
jgi:anti-sigma factor RsiW